MGQSIRLCLIHQLFIVIMSPIFRFSRSFILLMAVVFIMGLSVETVCSQTEKENASEAFMYEPNDLLDQDLDLDFTEDELTMHDMTSVSARDVQKVIAGSDGPITLWSGLKSEILLGEDGSLLKTSHSGIFTFGAEKLDVYRSSMLYLTNDNYPVSLNISSYRETFDLTNDLTGYTLPFAMFREDLFTISNIEDLINSSADGTSLTYMLMYDEIFDSYNMTIINEVFESDNMSTMNGDPIKLIRESYEMQSYGPEISSMPDGLGIDLSQYFTSDVWSQFGDIFNNPEIMKMFNEFAKEQLRRQQEENNQNDKQVYIEHLFDQCDGGVCVKWGTTI